MRVAGSEKPVRTFRNRWPAVARGAITLRPRRGFVTVDVVAACVILATLFALALPVVSRAGALRSQAVQHQVAVQEASNVLEKALLLRWEELTAERLSADGLSAAARAALPDGRLHVAVEVSDATPVSKRVTVEVFWRRFDGRERPVRLVAWFFQPEEQP